MLKTLYYIRNKKELQELYLSQMPENCIRSEINSILNETRKDIPPGMRLNAKNIKTEEALIFIDRNGTPDGYLLSEELKIKLKEFREAELKSKQFLIKINHVS
jgi:PHD/YefM family antitoxin component YafN of YafNO toxin-antitoxin module